MRSTHPALAGSLVLGLALALLSGAVAMILLRVVPIDQAYRAVDWRTVFLLAGLIPLGIAMDKLRSKQLFRAWGLETPGWALMESAGDARAILDALGLPLMVKPAREGSTIGISIAKNRQDLEHGLDEADGDE